MVYNFFEELKAIIIELFKNLYQKVKVIIIGITLSILFFGILFLKSDSVNLCETSFFKISLADWANWITVITLPCTAIWAVIQYNRNVLLRKQEKAAEIAKLFSDELLNKCSIVGAVINSSELGKLYNLKDTDMNKLQRFDRDEIIELYKGDEQFFNKYEKIFYSDELQSMYLYILESRISKKNLPEIENRDPKEVEEEIEKIMLNHYTPEEILMLKQRNMLKEEFKKYFLCNNHTEKELNKFYRKNYTDEEARKLFILDNENLPFRFVTLVFDVLNELEYICMYISSQSAGSNFVYQSLHQIFLRTIKSLAVTIADRNKNYADKLYTNVIYVYKEWSKKMSDNTRREKGNKRKAYKYLEPKIKTV